MPAPPSPDHRPPIRAEAEPVADTSSRAPLTIDCDECALQATPACDDCVVTFLCGVDAGVPVVVDLAEVRAMRLLDEAGLAPPLRHVHRTG